MNHAQEQLRFSLLKTKMTHIGSRQLKLETKFGEQCLISHFSISTIFLAIEMGLITICSLRFKATLLFTAFIFIKNGKL